MQIEIHANFNDLLINLDSLAKKQIPWAVTQTLNCIGKRAKEGLKTSLKKEFTIRNQYTENGIRQVNAQKSDWPFTSTEIGSVSPYMNLQAIGGEKRPKGGLPFGTPINARSTKTQIIPKNIRIPNIMNNTASVIKKNFMPINLHDGRKIIIQNVISRTRKNRWRGGKSNPYMHHHTGGRGWLRTVMYKIVPTVLIPKRWKIEEIVTNTIESNLENDFKKSMNDALRTVR